MGIAERAVANWMAMRYFPTIDCARRIANAFDCSLDYLFGLSESKTNINRDSSLDFVLKFQTLCRKKGVTQYRVAKECGFGESMISKWKHGKYPKTETLIKLANYFGCTLDFLVGRVS